MKRTLLVGGMLACLLLGGLITVQGANSKTSQIGYVNMSKLFKNHPQKQASESKLKQKAQKLQQKLKQKAKELSKQERQELLQKYQQQLKKLEQELIQGVMADINQEVREVADKKGVTVVLDKSVVISGGNDLTAAVLEEIEAENKPSPSTSESSQKTATEKN